MSHSDDPVDEVERAMMQIPYLLAQGIETAARVRVMRAERHEHAERSSAEAEVRAAAEAARQLQAERDHALPTWHRADDKAWVRSAAPADLFETWAAAAAWQQHDRAAAASAQRAEAEMRRRWPGQMRLYDDARMAGLPAVEAMRNMVTTATNAGWDPTRPARPQPSAASRPALQAAPAVSSVRTDRDPGVTEPLLSPAERAMRYVPAMPGSQLHAAPTAARPPVRQPQRRAPRRG